MLTETVKEFASIQLDRYGCLWVSESIVVTDGNAEIARTILRTSYAPGEDIPPDAPPQVSTMAAIAWTPEVVAAYKAKQAETSPEGE